MTIDLLLQVPPAALILAGIAYYFRTGAYAEEYGEKTEKLRIYLLSEMVGDASQAVASAPPGPGGANPQNPYFAEAGLDRLVLQRILTSAKTLDYQRIAEMPEMGNTYLRGTGLSLIGLGGSYYLVLLFLPLEYLVIVLLFVGLSVYFFIRYHLLVREIDKRTTDLKKGLFEAPWTNRNG